MDEKWNYVGSEWPPLAFVKLSDTSKCLVHLDCLRTSVAHLWAGLLYLLLCQWRLLHSCVTLWHVIKSCRDIVWNVAYVTCEMWDRMILFEIWNWFCRPCVKFQAPARWRCVRLSNSENGNWQDSSERIACKVKDARQQAVKRWFYLVHALALF